MENDTRQLTRDDWEHIVRSGIHAFFTHMWAFFKARSIRLLLLAGILYLLWRLQTVVTTVIAAGILASAAGAFVDPLMRFKPLMKVPRHTRRAIAAGLVLAAILAALVGIIVVFLQPFQVEFKNLVNDWPNIQAQITKQTEQLKTTWEGLPDWVQKLAPQGGSGSKTGGAEQSPEIGKSITTYLTGLVSKTLSAAAHIVELILVPVMAYYFIVDGRDLKREFLRFLPVRKQRLAHAVMMEGALIMRSFLIAQFVLAAIAGVVIGLLLGVFQIKYALTLALIAAVTRVVPVIGPLLGGIPLGILVFVQCSSNGNYGSLIIILGLFTLMHLAESKIITPMILGDRLHLHAVIVIIALLVGGEFFGLMGMFLAAPVAALARLLLMHYYVYPQQARQRKADHMSRAVKANTQQA